MRRILCFGTIWTYVKGYWTGSGKTYTMGTGFEDESPYHLPGIITRAIRSIFDQANAKKEEGVRFEFDCQFLELYNEEIVDLLAKKDAFASLVLKTQGSPKLELYLLLVWSLSVDAKNLEMRRFLEMQIVVYFLLRKINLA
ncbi:hypothetical protein QYM36_018285 [Artemia franciscana]|uniref:Kinesin motor domain-containing protein n=1 Tax=Artemia franciscana TaxID=6661 RepID=A0AA88H6X2_ARTSF|nr:hypothetical protein QYM36_018285 [Artemia franciscana]